MSLTFQSINPVNNQVIQHYSAHNAQEVEIRIQQANKAYKSWRKTSFTQRADCFKKMALLLEQSAKTAAQIISLEMGKPLQQSIAEVEKCAWVCRYYAENAQQFLQDEKIPTENGSNTVVYQPVGIILQIMPWNFPFWQVFRFAAPALMAGNVTLLKHAPNVLGCSQFIAKLFEQAGFPSFVFQEVYSDNALTANVIAHPLVEGIALTGSMQAGRAVGSLAGANIKKCVLELGGSDPFVVLKDANIEAAAAAAVKSRMHNSGQTCISAKRIIVEKAIYKEFKTLVIQHIQALKVGQPEEDCNITVLARQDLTNKLQEQVQQSIKQGAIIELDGGQVHDTNVFRPMVLSNIKKGMPAYDDEIFGPVLCLFEVDHAEEALTLANDTEFGLGASIWTADQELAKKFSLEIESGAVAINQVLRSDPRIPFGGNKRSGIGRELGRAGVLAFCNMKSIMGL